jgi:FkbM family methyltransferase
MADGNATAKSAAAELPPMPRRIAAWAKGAPLLLAPMQQVHATIAGKPVIFHLNTPDDPIQDCHRRGRFYEGEELAALARLMPPEPVVLDIGANVGNHALFFALFCGARRVMVVEPNPLALEPLVANVLANRLERRINLTFLGFGLADRDEGGFTMKEHRRNLGATRMFAGTDGPLRVRRGDAVFPRARPNLVKLDVEGMEMEVLSGLDRLFRRAKPILMVEVADKDAEAFAAWALERDYRLAFNKPVAKAKENYILLPPGHPGAPLT